MWENRSGHNITHTMPLLRIMLRVMLTNSTDGTFKVHKILKNEIVSDTNSNENVLIKRRKPSNPDYVKNNNFLLSFLNHLDLLSKLI